MEIPDWLKQKTAVSSQPAPLRQPRYREHGRGGARPGQSAVKKPKERFLDKTLRHVISFTEDMIFNEKMSRKKGLLQKIEPRLKIGSLILFIILLSLQRSIDGAVIFLVVSLLLAFLSKIPLSLFLKRLFPIALFTTFISFPAIFSIIVDGDPVLIIYRADTIHKIGPVEIPAVISLTRQGIFSASMLILRVITSVSIVFLITLTTPPHSLLKAITYFMPGTLKSIVSISYRYIFFLVRKVEEFVIAFRSRTFATIKTFRNQSWIASRVGLLFSLSLKLSQDLERAMESRGYRKE